MRKRIGRQEPTVWSTLPYRKSMGPEVVKAYEQTGQKVMKWQKLQIKYILAKAFGTTAKAIQQLNPNKIKNIIAIQTGWILRVK